MLMLIASLKKAGKQGPRYRFWGPPLHVYRVSFPGAPGPYRVFPKERPPPNERPGGAH
jgi:hypothetical protein